MQVLLLVVRFHFFVPIKRTEILFTKSSFQVHNVTVSFGGRAPPGPGGGAYITLVNPLRWILRGPLAEKGESREGRGIKRRAWAPAGMGKGGHMPPPLENSKCIQKYVNVTVIGCYML